MKCLMTRIICLLSIGSFYSIPLLAKENEAFVNQKIEQLSCQELPQALKEYHEMMSQIARLLSQMADDSIHMRKEVLRNLEAAPEQRKEFARFVSGSVDRLQAVKQTNSESMEKSLNVGSQLIERSSQCILTSAKPKSHQ